MKDRIQAAQTRAVLAVNNELVRLYWDIGGLAPPPGPSPERADYLQMLHFGSTWMEQA